MFLDSLVMHLLVYAEDCGQRDLLEVITLSSLSDRLFRSSEERKSKNSSSVSVQSLLHTPKMLPRTML